MEVHDFDNIQHKEHKMIVPAKRFIIIGVDKDGEPSVIDTQDNEEMAYGQAEWLREEYKARVIDTQNMYDCLNEEWRDIEILLGDRTCNKRVTDTIIAVSNEIDQKYIGTYKIHTAYNDPDDDPNIPKNPYQMISIANKSKNRITGLMSHVVNHGENDEHEIMTRISQEGIEQLRAAVEKHKVKELAKELSEN